MKRSYETTPTMPEELGNIPDHPQPTSMNLGWSHRGEWQETPVDPSQEGSEQEECRVARVEPYIDTDGVIKRALSYGDEAERLTVWFSLEEVQKAYPKWRVANPPKFFNSKKFNKTARRDLQENRRDKKRGNLPPGDQSYKDIQGGRGGGRGRGSGRGGYQPYNRGRGRPTYGSDRRDREYREWDDSQDNQQGSSKSHGQRNWEEYEDQYKKKGIDRDPQGYYTKEYEDRKRARSPSSRGERPSREDRDYQRREYSPDRRRDSNRREYSPDRREYIPERRSRWDYSPEQGPERRRERSRREYTPEKGRRYPGQER